MSCGFADLPVKFYALPAHLIGMAAHEMRITVSRDKSTMPDHAGQRIREGLPMTGLLLIGRHYRSQVREIIEDLLLIADDDAEEWGNRIEYLPV